MDEIATVLSGYAFAGNWLLVVCGWLVVNWQTNRRERRKEIRAAIDTIEDLVLDVEVAARKYYQLAGTDSDAKALALEIKSLTRRLAARMAALANFRSEFHSEQQLISFRAAVTGGDFESASRQPLDLTHQRYLEISNEAVALVSFLDGKYAKL